MARYRLTGFSLPWFGIQWERVKDQDAATARAVVAYLEDRRLLFGLRHSGDEQHCVASASEIRSELTRRITTDDIGPDLTNTLKGMRAVCRAFMDAAGPGATFLHRDEPPGNTDLFSVALGELRSQMGFYLALLADQYALTVDSDLGRILPPRLLDEDDLNWMPGFE